MSSVEIKHMVSLNINLNLRSTLLDFSLVTEPNLCGRALQRKEKEQLGEIEIDASSPSHRGTPTKGTCHPDLPKCESVHTWGTAPPKLNVRLDAYANTAWKTCGVPE